MNCDQRLTDEPKCDVCIDPGKYLKELMAVNKSWKQEYELLQKKYKEEKDQLQEDNHKLKQEVRRSELRCSKLEIKNLTLQGELVRLVTTFDTAHADCSNVDKECCGGAANVELIREQLDVYKEDFKLEHQDKEKIQSEKASLEERLLQCEKLVISLNKELDLYKKECKRLHEEQGRSRWDQKHPGIDRSHSYPSTSSRSYKEGSTSSMTNIALPPSLAGKKESYSSLEDFRHEQFKRGILVRNAAQVRAPPPLGLQPTARRLSDSSSSSTLEQSHSSRTSCLW